jgi:hypothetical protein
MVSRATLPGRPRGQGASPRKPPSRWRSSRGGSLGFWVNGCLDERAGGPPLTSSGHVRDLGSSPIIRPSHRRGRPFFRGRRRGERRPSCFCGMGLGPGSDPTSRRSAGEGRGTRPPQGESVLVAARRVAAFSRYGCQGEPRRPSAHESWPNSGLAQRRYNATTREARLPFRGERPPWTRSDCADLQVLCPPSSVVVLVGAACPAGGRGFESRRSRSAGCRILSQ